MSPKHPHDEPEEQFLFSLDLTEFEESGKAGRRSGGMRTQPGASGVAGGKTARKVVEEANRRTTGDHVSASGAEGAEAPAGPASTSASIAATAGPPNLDEAKAEMTRAEVAAFHRSKPEYLLDRARRVFHRVLLDERVLVLNPASGVPSNADKDSPSSIRYARFVADGIGGVPEISRAPGKGVSRNFERAVAAYLKSVTQALDAVRPGDWVVRRLGDREEWTGIEDASEIFEQYDHLPGMRESILGRRDLRALMGHDAEIMAPDVVIARHPVSDSELNGSARLVDPMGPLASSSPLRSAVQSKLLLHAVVSCKWTLRSDRAEQIKAEARHLIRNRRGRIPHLVLVTGEPMPSRIASVALGTGDLDCVYHFALHELLDAIDPETDPAGAELLHTMVQGRRLRDISDLPLDLAI
ncbi:MULTISPECIES: NgoMIV family type II restriction endonuclease [Micrococcaceae]|uniref:NgoMIV family type II restriction endonuclease n=1 Tax=unclassified Kocuria TaxID=2649579 RepID=UPI001011E468|nr:MULTISPECIES: NgoMIV family type II restriction endonuclease [unclassified Kocuria]